MCPKEKHLESKGGVIVLSTRSSITTRSFSALHLCSFDLLNNKKRKEEVGIHLDRKSLLKKGKGKKHHSRHFISIEYGTRSTSCYCALLCTTVPYPTGNILQRLRFFSFKQQKKGGRRSKAIKKNIILVVFGRKEGERTKTKQKKHNPHTNFSSLDGRIEREQHI